MDPRAKRRLGKSGVELPLLGFGGAPLGELFVKVTEADAEATLQTAWDAGSATTTPRPGMGAAVASTGSAASSTASRAASSCCRPRSAACSSAPREPGARSITGFWSGGLQFDHVFDYSYDGDHARLRGQPAAARHEPHRPPGHPRPRLLAPRHRGQGRSAYLGQLVDGGLRALEELRAAAGSGPSAPASTSSA